ncbi:MAG: efflux RND transporter permease subunit [Bacteroidales bacterium]|nr:efflux RND transporter permease subunit [Bacteroidales bacterium]
MKKQKTISPFTVIVSALCLSIIGIAFLPFLPLKLQPSEKMPSIYVNFSMNNATSKIVESEVTSRLEAMFSRMNGVEEINSTSYNGGGYITIKLDKHADIETSRFEISMLIRQVWPDLPQGVSYPYIMVQGASDENNPIFLSYTINALAEPSVILENAERVFQTGFSEFPDVSKVEITGAQRKQRKLEYDVDLIQKLGLNENDIQKAISNYRTKINIGKYTLSTNISDSSLILSDIYLPLPNGGQIGLNRLVKMKYQDADPTFVRRINGLNSIYLNISSTENANQIELQKKVVEKINILKKRLPQGYELNLAYDATEQISEELDKIYFRSGLTILILLVFIWITSFSWRQVVVVVCSLICNLAVACLAYYLLGVELQLYSLAGITISLNLIIDNTIIMADHWRREHNLTAILPIISATLTTIGALSIVFFLDDRIKLSLYDFSVVMIVNLFISMFTALWVVPAIIQLQKDVKIKSLSKRRLRFAVHFNHGYQKFIKFIVNHKKLTFIIGIWGFGIPLFLMPKEIKSDSKFASFYNTIFGSKVYQESIRPYTDVIFGGSLRLFAEKVMTGQYWGSGRNQVVLQVYATLPYGTTFNQMDYLMRKMESYLSQFKEIKHFETTVEAQQGNISIYFTKETEHGVFPYTLKSNIISKGLQLGGGSWSVYGLQDQGFSNDVRESAGSYKIDMAGYNYERLLDWADTVKNFLLTHKRIKEVMINSTEQYYKSDYQEYHLKPKTEEMIKQNISPLYLFWVIQQSFVNNQGCGTVWNGDRLEEIIMYTKQSEEYNIWSLLNRPVEINGRMYKINQLCTFEKEQSAQDIRKSNQQYQLCLQYEYIGSSIMGDKVLQETDSIYTQRLPIGYSIKADRRYYWFGNENSNHYLLLALVLAIIIFITSILFNSLKHPLIIVATIPIAYIGLFLTFYLFSIKFDTGGFAAMVLLCGITVNASIYIVNEFQIKQQRRKTRHAYIKAFSIKIIPILLTVLSTVLGFIPFIIGVEKEGFWFPLSVGTIGGLVMSLIGIMIFLPALCLKKKDFK